MNGNESERPVHTVRINSPFAIGRYEVTFEEYDQFAAATGQEWIRDGGWGRGRLPVINVSWNEAMDYAEWLSRQTVKRYRLPTEAEWEYAARAGTETAYWWGNEMKSGMANCNDGSSEWSGQKTAPVGSFKPNRSVSTTWQVMCGSGCRIAGMRITKVPLKMDRCGKRRGGKCGQRVVRGGSWTRTPGYVRSSYRIKFVTDVRGYDIGFRLAQDLD